MDKRNRWYIVAAGGAALLLMLLLWWARHRTPQLMEKATFIADETDVEGTDGSGSYYWLSNNALFTTDDPASNFYQYDLSTHQRTKLDALSQFVQKHGKEASDWSLSPDGNHVLWASSNDNQESNEGSSLYAATMEGEDLKPRKYASVQPYAMLWMQDNQHWLALMSDPSDSSLIASARLGSIASSEVRKVPIEKSNPLNSQDAASGTLVTTEQGHLILPAWPGSFSEVVQKITFFELDPEHGFQTICQNSVTLPAGRTLEDISLSPKGDKVAVLLEQEIITPLQALLRRYVTLPQTNTSSVMELWVSPLHDSKLRLIGVVANKPPVSSTAAGAAPTGTGRPQYGETSSQAISWIQWMPDGKRISFSGVDNRIYTVSASD